MGWIDPTERHEGFVVCVFADARLGKGWATDGIPLIGTDGTTATDAAGDPAEVRPPAAVVGWRIGCFHTSNRFPDAFRPEFWTGPNVWRRVYSAAEEDLAAKKIYAPWQNTSAAFLGDEHPEATKGLRREWDEHVIPDEHARSIREAVGQAAAAAQLVDLEVAAARAAGVTWAVIGGAAGMSRQSAHARWAGPHSA